MSTATIPAPAPFSVLRADVWQTLGKRLDAIIADYAVLGIVRDSVLRPLRLLEAMAADAPAALGDDFFAAERLRALLYLAAPWRALPAEAAQLAASGPPAQPYQPGILHHGKLVVVGLAAVRVAPVAAAADLLATVHGLALALSVAEVFGRLEPGAPDGTALETMLLTLVGLGDASGAPSPNLLRPFALDGTERGRWSCLAELFGGDALGSFVRERLQAEKSGKVLWDAASSDAVTALEPSSASRGSRIQVRGQFDVPPPQKGKSTAKDAAKDADGFQVVFVGADGTSHLGDVSRRTKTQLTVAVPRDARSGWIGLSDPARLASSNRYRKSVRDFWSGLALPTVPARPAGFLSCLRDAPVPVDELPDLGRTDRPSKKAFSIPPRTANNRFVIASAATLPAAATPTAEPLITQPRGAGPSLVDGDPTGIDPTGGDGTTTGPTGTTGGTGTGTGTGSTGSTGGGTGGTGGTGAGGGTGGKERSDVSATATQNGLNAPFVAGELVDVVVTFPARTVKHLTFIFDPDDPGSRVEQDVGEDNPGNVTMQIPGDQVKIPTLAFTVSVTSPTSEVPDPGPSKSFVVQAAKILDVTAKQDENGPPFTEGVPVEVVVTFDANGAESSFDVVLQLDEDGSKPKATSIDAGTVKFQISGDEVSPKQLTFSVSLESDGEVVDSVDPEPTFDVNPAPLEIGKITVAQGKSVEPFEAGKPLDVTIPYTPTKAKVDATISIDGNTVATGTGTNGTAKLQIPGDVVTTDSVELKVKLSNDATNQSDSATKTVNVIAPMKIRTVTATQESVGPPFIANEPVEVDVTYDPSDVEGVVTITPPDATSQDLVATQSEPGHAVVQIPNVFVQKGQLQFTVNLKMKGDAAPRDTSPQSFTVVTPVGLTVVLFRPTVLRTTGPTRISDTRRDQLVKDASRRLALTLGVVELPWVEDPLAVIGSDVLGAEDPRVPVLFEALSRAAAFTAGFEGAPWVAMVPSGASPPNQDGTTVAVTGFETHVPAETALTLGVCNEDGLSLLLAQVPNLLLTQPPRPALPRLRVVGAVDQNGTITVEPAREEIRAAGPGAPIASGIVAISFDVDGRPLLRAPIRTVRDGDVVTFVQLVPVTPEVDLVELRRGVTIVAELRRPEGTPSLDGFKFSPDTAVPTLQWIYAHTNGATPALDFELFHTVGGTFAFTADPCFSRVVVPRQRLPIFTPTSAADKLQVRLVATDGWNTAFSKPLVLDNVTDNLIIRRVIGVVGTSRATALPFVRFTGVQWWADTTLPGPFDWSLDGVPQTAVDTAGRLIRLDVNARGLLKVVARKADGGIGLTDTREIA